MKSNATPVSDGAHRRIREAIDAIKGDPGLRRTKRQIEQLAELSHATVARAFVQDLHEPTPHTINEAFDSLVQSTGGRSVEQVQRQDLQARLDERTRRVAELEAAETTHLQALYALHLQLAGDDASATVTPIKRPRTAR